MTMTVSHTIMSTLWKKNIVAGNRFVIKNNCLLSHLSLTDSRNTKENAVKKISNIHTNSSNQQKIPNEKLTKDEVKLKTFKCSSEEKIGKTLDNCKSGSKQINRQIFLKENEDIKDAEKDNSTYL